MNKEKSDFTQGSILGKLIPFMMPILGALILQAAYGAVDLLVVGRFGTTEGLSAVSTGSQVLNLVTFVITQFAINQFGYSNCGLSSSKLVKLADDNPYIDALGFNCGIGPGHMEQFILKERRHTDKYLSALPNAGYPQAVSGRMIFSDKNMDYYSDKMCELLNAGADIIGGCCGTTPDYICLLYTSPSPRD